VIRGGYGVFFIPNYVSFGLNPDNDIVNLATTPFTATIDSYVTPYSTLNGNNCTLAGVNFASFSCASTAGPFGAGGILLAPGRNAQPTLSQYVATNGSPNLAPNSDPKYGYVEQYNLDIQRQLPAGFFVDVAYAGSHGVHLQQYNTNINQIPDSFLSQQAGLIAQVPNPLSCPNTGLNGSNGGGVNGCPLPTLNGATINAGQLDRPYPQYNGLTLNGFGCCESTYNSFQATATRRFAGGGTLLVAYTNAKLMSNTDTLTSWLEGPTGGVGGIQDWNNLKGERSLSSQDVSQRLVISYVLDLPFGHGKMFASGLTGAASKVVSGWGLDGQTAFQRGFPMKVSYSGSTALENANLGVANVRPDVVSGCNKKTGGTIGTSAPWFNTTCFTAPPDWGFGNEARVDPNLRMPGTNNWDMAIFKRTAITERMGLEFRAEFFNLFNHPPFAPPAEGFNGHYPTLPGGGTDPLYNGFGEITSTVVGGGAAEERLVQMVLKLVF
jgi:hypothetical protein